jgi:hypothetical protein
VTRVGQCVSEIQHVVPAGAGFAGPSLRTAPSCHVSDG